MTRPTGLTAIRRWLSELMTRPTGETEKERDLPTDLARTTVKRSMKGTRLPRSLVDSHARRVIGARDR